MPKTDDGEVTGDNFTALCPRASPGVAGRCGPSGGDCPYYPHSTAANIDYTPSHHHVTASLHGTNIEFFSIKGEKVQILVSGHCP